jgi:hypothetical protein
MKFIEIPYPLQDLEVTVTCGNIQLLPRHGYHGYTFPPMHTVAVTSCQSRLAPGKQAQG